MILPERPLALSPRYKQVAVPALAGLLFGGAFLGLGVALPAQEALGIVADSGVWQRGVGAAGAEVSGRHTSHRLVFHSYDLKVGWRDAAGAKHQRQVSFETLFATVDMTSPSEVRYDPGDPGRCAVSWAVAAIPSRWLASASTFVVVGCLVGPSTILFGLNLWRDFLAARAAGLRSDEVILEVTAARPSSANLRSRYHYQGRTPAGVELKGSVDATPALGEPLFLDANRTWMVALVPPGGTRPVIVRHDFLPYLLTPTQLERVRSNLRKV